MALFALRLRSFPTPIRPTPIRRCPNIAPTPTRRSDRSLPSCLWFIPGSQIFLDEIRRLLRSHRTIQNLSTGVPEIVLIVRIAVTRQDLVGAAERSCPLFAPVGKLLCHRITQRITDISQRKEARQRVGIYLRKLLRGYPSKEGSCGFLVFAGGV